MVVPKLYERNAKYGGKIFFMFGCLEIYPKEILISVKASLCKNFTKHLSYEKHKKLGKILGDTLYQQQPPTLPFHSFSLFFSLFFGENY